METTGLEPQPPTEHIPVKALPGENSDNNQDVWAGGSLSEFVV